MNRPLRVGSCFSGIGGLELGFEPPDYEIVFQVEIDPGCRNVLARHWPDAARYNDITEVTYERLHADLGQRADVDVLVGGWPCQDISLAGNRRGLAGARSGLFFEFARLALELAPLWIVAENVPGLLSSYSPVEPPPSGLSADDEWRVEETSDLGVVCSTLGELGYGYAGRCLDAQFFGVPQRRRRIFFVGHLGAPWSCAPEVLFEPDSSEGDPAESAEEGQDDAPSVADGPGTDGGAGTPGTAVRDRQRDGEIVSALTSHQGGPDFKHAEAGHLVSQVLGVTEPDVAGPLGAGPHGHRQDFDSAGAYVLEEEPWQCHGDNVGPMGTLRQGNGGVTGGVPFTAQVIGGEDTDVARALTSPVNGPRYDLDSENLVLDSETPIYAVHNGEDVIISENVAQPLTVAKGTPGNIAIPYVRAVSMRGREEGNVPELEEDDVSPALRTGQGGSGNPMVITGPVPFRKSRRAQSTEDEETWVEDDVTNTLNVFDVGDIRTTTAIVEAIPIELRMATRTSGATGAGTPGTGFGEPGDPSYPVMQSPPPATQVDLIVRRLTPLECTRLQGFPDGWVQDTGFVQSDSQAYKQLGNAVAVPCATWIARRLLEVHERVHGEH